MRTKRSLVRVTTLMLVAVTACSPGHSHATRAVTSTTGAPKVTTSTTTPKQAGIELARRVLDEVLLPPGARPAHALPPLLSRLFRSTTGENEFSQFAAAHAAFTVALEPPVLVQFLQTKVPTGFMPVPTGGSEIGPHGQQLWVSGQELRSVPPSVSFARREYSVEANAKGSVVVVEARVLWVEPRPAASFVPARDRVVTVTAVLEDKRSTVVRRDVVTNPAEVARIRRAFNALHTNPPGIPSCSPGTETPVDQRVGFAVSSGAPPDVVAVSSGACPGGAVVVNARGVRASVEDRFSAYWRAVHGAVS